MLVLEDAILKKENRKNFVALGSFDGLHKGHLSLIRKIKQLAEEGKGQSIVYTFKNHPRKFLNSNNTAMAPCFLESYHDVFHPDVVHILVHQQNMNHKIYI